MEWMPHPIKGSRARVRVYIYMGTWFSSHQGPDPQILGSWDLVGLGTHPEGVLGVMIHGMQGVMSCSVGLPIHVRYTFSLVYKGYTY